MSNEEHSELEFLRERIRALQEEVEELKLRLKPSPLFEIPIPGEISSPPVPEPESHPVIWTGGEEA